MTWQLRTIVATLLAGCMTAAALAQPQFDFMPDGGKEVLTQLLQAGRLQIVEVTTRRASDEEWRSIITVADASLSESAVATLASYLAINMPTKVPESKVEQLPLDGKELAIENCQFCHSFFTGYLVHDRETEGWRAIFKSPFHMELPMDASQRETFARYSAINMPISYEDVPEDLRF